MSLSVLLAVGALGGVGAMARFLLDGEVSRRVAHPFPFGTLAVNLTGALLFGLVVGSTLSGDALRLVTLGLLGGYTTFSTWAFESHRLAEDGRSALAAANFAVSLLLGIAAAWGGREIGLLLW